MLMLKMEPLILNLIPIDMVQHESCRQMWLDPDRCSQVHWKMHTPRSLCIVVNAASFELIDGLVEFCGLGTEMAGASAPTQLIICCFVLNYALMVIDFTFLSAVHIFMSHPALSVVVAARSSTCKYFFAWKCS